MLWLLPLTLIAAAPAEDTLFARDAVLGDMKGVHNNDIGSWFRANNDGTNGRSWCEFEYDDSMPIVAVPIDLMSSWKSGGRMDENAKKHYCGKELILKAKDVNGNWQQATAYIGDAFDQRWVRTKYSLDIMYDLFRQLRGEDQQDDKNIVFKKGDMEWWLTDGFNEKYSFKGGQA